jgi:putative transcription factor
LRCEVCGQEIRGEPYYRIIEGGRMTVCGICAKFSDKAWDPRKPMAQPRRRSAAARTQPRRRTDIEIAESTELVENYGSLIRRTRQRKGLTVEDFAKKLSEKESVIKKLEKEQLNPTMALIRKVERELGITLIEEAEVGTGTVLTRPMGPRTLGDMIKLKPDEKDEEEG